MGGAPVFVGTRVPVETLTDHLAGGDDLDVVFDDFPSVTRDQAMRALDLALSSLEAAATIDARPAR
ncbi:MAG: DUF433 domain-containing protein [Chloroflexota bacterium]|nr:DUF433 domain-containing protein [Chloroflexota bacterium]